MLPHEIEATSMRIIQTELTGRGITLAHDCKDIILRVIHATADFDFAHIMQFSHGVCEQAATLFQTAAPVIITDTNMALAGINKRTCAALHISAACYMADKDVADAAARHGTTRAQESVNKMARLYADTEKPVVFVCGNAPTALMRLCALMQDRTFTPALVIGVPVGFVHVEEAKEQLAASPVPYIITSGRKGGSTVAAAICNALLYKAAQ